MKNKVKKPILIMGENLLLDINEKRKRPIRIGNTYFRAEYAHALYRWFKKADKYLKQEKKLNKKYQFRGPI